MTPEPAEPGTRRNPPIGVVDLHGDWMARVRRFANRGPVLVFDISQAGPTPSETATGFETTRDLERLADPDTILLGVPAAVTAAGGADLTALIGAARVIASRLRVGQLVILTSFVPPGAARAHVLPVLTGGGLVAGRDFFLASSPDPVDTAIESRVAGGHDPESLDRASALFGSLGVAVVRVVSLEAAELCGLVRPAWGSVREGMANVLKLLCDRMGVDVWEVLEAGGLPDLVPTPGGCDPATALLTWGARRFEASTRLIELAGEVNTAMPAFVVSKVADALNDAGKPVKGSRVLILGMAYKKDIDDPRESPGFELMDLLLKKGAAVSYNDPHIPELPRMRHWPHLAMTSSALSPEFLAAQDCVLIATDHTAYDYRFIVEHSRLVIDTRNATKAITAGREKIVRA